MELSPLPAFPKWFLELHSRAWKPKTREFASKLYDADEDERAIQWEGYSLAKSRIRGQHSIATIGTSPYEWAEKSHVMARFSIPMWERAEKGCVYGPLVFPTDSWTSFFGQWSVIDTVGPTRRKVLKLRNILLQNESYTGWNGLEKSRICGKWVTLTSPSGS